MRAIDRLLISDVRRKLGQSLAIVAVLACGVATFVMSIGVHRTLDVSRERYYRDHRFANVFAPLTRAPESVAARLRDVPGVQRVETRVVHSAIVDLPTIDEPVTTRLLSLPDDAVAGLNAVHLRRGRWPRAEARGEVVASEPFAEANRLRPGARIRVVMAGVRQELTIVGIGLSPEYVFAVQPGQFLPDDRRFGILWMPRRQMEAAFNMEGAFNDVSFLLRPRASTADVLARVDRILEPYGGRGSYDREQQYSHRRVSDELKQLQSMAVVMPLIFLTVAAFLLNLVFTRMVDHEQEQIATLRAFGYTSREIGWHYLQRLAILVVAGVAIGSAAGVWMGRGMSAAYTMFFRFPVLEHRVAWDGIAAALAISLVAGLVGGAAALRRASSLPAAVAMRPPAPRSFRPALLERIGLGRFLSPITSMILRRLERNWRSSLLSVLAMSLGLALLVLGSFFEDTIDYVLESIFERTQRQNVTLVFNETVSARGLHDVRALPGVVDAEPFRSTPVRLRHGRNEELLSLMGLEERPRLFRVIDREERPVEIAQSGLTISEKLGEKLGVGPGDQVDVEFLEGGHEDQRMVVSHVFRDYAEPTAYVNRRTLHRVLEEGERLSGAFLAVDPTRTPDLSRAVAETPAVAGITYKDAAKESFRSMIAEHTRRMRTVNGMFAVVIAFGVIYSCAVITLAERSRDLATMRVIGFTKAEVASVLLGELAVITLASIPVGLPFGYWLSHLTVVAMDTESQRFPLVVSRATFAYATLVILAAATVSSLFVARMVARLDLVAVLKVRE